MADLSDVTTFIYNQCISAAYPNGTSSPSIAPAPPGFANPMDIRVLEGWPLSDQLDRDLGGTMLSGNPPVPIKRPNGPCANVSVFPLAGTGNSIYQIQDKTYVLTQPTISLTVTVSGTPGSPTQPTQITVTGTPSSGEFVTIIADRQFDYSRGGSTSTDILSVLLTDVQANYPAATLVGNTLTIPTSYALTVRQGGVGTLGKVIQRQCQYVAVTVWAPNPQSRSVIASAVDIALKRNIVVALPDGSDAKIVFSRTTIDDRNQNPTIYRRDLVYEVDYATVDTFPGTTITSSDITLAASEYDFAPAQTSIIS